MRRMRDLALVALLLSAAGCLGTSSSGAPAGGAAAPADLPAPHRTVRVASVPALQAALDAAGPGDHVVLEAGSYRTDGPLRVARSGREGAPIVVRAATVGGAEIGGAAGFDLDGADHVVLYGFRFTHGATQEIPPGSEHVRVARNTFQLQDSADHWLRVSGDDAEVDHNTFQHKRTLGVYLALEGPREDNAKRAHVHHNYFHDHQFEGANGGESIRAGLSWRSLWSANALIEHNLFERADGDPEAISVKSSDNVIRGNTFRNGKGCIVLRHGNRTTVEGNFLIDSGCGIRAYGNEHRIFNNYVEGARGPGMTIGSGMYRDHEPDHTPKQRQGYDASERMRVTFNTLVDNAIGIVGEDREHAPRENVIANNLVRGEGGALVRFAGNDPIDFRWEGNLFSGGEVAEVVPQAGYARTDPMLVRGEDGLLRPAPGSPALDAAAGAFPQVEVDMDGQPRVGAKDVGADERSDAPVTARPLTRADVGPLAP